METMSISQARTQLPALARLLREDPAKGPVTVTRRNKPVLSIMPWETYEALVETLDILGDEQLMMELRQSIRELKTGDTLTLEETKSALGLH